MNAAERKRIEVGRRIVGAPPPDIIASEPYRLAWLRLCDEVGKIAVKNPRLAEETAFRKRLQLMLHFIRKRKR